MNATRKCDSKKVRPPPGEGRPRAPNPVWGRGGVGHVTGVGVAPNLLFSVLLFSASIAQRDAAVAEIGRAVVTERDPAHSGPPATARFT